MQIHREERFEPEKAYQNTVDKFTKMQNIYHNTAIIPKPQKIGKRP